jgi:hypothetical protein
LSQVVKCAPKANTEEESRFQSQQRGGSVAVESRKLIANAERSRAHEGFVGFLPSSEKSGVSQVGGRKRVSKEVRALIFRMVAEDPTWGAPRIHGELLKLGFDLSERSVS